MIEINDQIHVQHQRLSELSYTTTPGWGVEGEGHQSSGQKSIKKLLNF